MDPVTADPDFGACAPNMAIVPPRTQKMKKRPVLFMTTVPLQPPTTAVGEELVIYFFAGSSPITTGLTSP
jgi:hypothetical protein